MVTNVQLGNAKFVALPLSLEAVHGTLRNGDNLEVFLENDYKVVLENFFNKDRVLLANVDSGLEVEQFVFSEDGNIVGVESVQYDQIQDLIGEGAVKELATQGSDILLFSEPAEEPMVEVAQDDGSFTFASGLALAGVTSLIGVGLVLSEKHPSYENDKTNTEFFSKALKVTEVVLEESVAAVAVNADDSVSYPTVSNTQTVEEPQQLVLV